MKFYKCFVDQGLNQYSSTRFRKDNKIYGFYKISPQNTLKNEIIGIFYRKFEELT